MALVLASGAVWADDQDSDSLTITITPSVDFGVDLDTGTTELDGTLLSVAKALTLNTTAFLTSPATMTILGDFNNQEVSVQAVGLDTWTVDTDENIGLDEVQVYALFTNTSRGEGDTPSEADFDQGSDGRHLVTGTPVFAGEVSENDLDDDNNYEYVGLAPGGIDMDNMQVGDKRHLWLRLDTPGTTSVSGTDQRIQITLTAESGVVN